MSIFKPKTNSEKYLAFLKKCRKQGIPEKYNQGLILDYLTDPDIDLNVSITTRTDGKTFNVNYLLARLAREFGFCTLIVVRHAEIRNAMIEQIHDVYTKGYGLDDKNFSFNINMDVTSIYDGELTSFLVCDLNNANDLKNYSATLKQANVIEYDEFLAVGGEYTNAEFAKWKTIFETMDRGETPAMAYTNHLRKAIFLANPVDFGSEFLAHYDMYEMLEKQPMNTIQKHGNIALERRRNLNAQTGKNNRLFRESESVTGEFDLNSWQLKKPKNTDLPVIVKTNDTFIYIYDNRNQPIISVKPYANHYDYNTELNDNRDTSIYLKADRYFKDNFFKKYTRELIGFENQYSKDYILQTYPSLNIFKLIREQRQPVNADTEIKKLDQAEKDIQLKRIYQQYIM